MLVGSIVLWLAAIGIGFVVLNQGAKFLTDNAAKLSRKIGSSRFVIGALLVSTLSAMPCAMASMSRPASPP